MKDKSRRNFIKTSATAAAGMAVMPESILIPKKGRIAGANDRIRIGILGCGTNGTANMKLLYENAVQHSLNIEITALCDTWRIAREETSAIVKNWYGRSPEMYGTYREMLEKNTVDAVYIGTPDHLHTTHLKACAQAKKHVYVQKPLSMDMNELNDACDAVKKAGIIAQVGTQGRSYPGIAGARQAYKNGLTGRLSRVEECRNSSKPYWYKYLREVRKEDVNWKEFLNDRPMRPFSSDAYSAWYGYYDFSHGPITNLGAHFIDTVHYITGCGIPESCVCLGGIFTWKDEHKFTVPDCVQATWIYPEGFLVSSSNNTGNGSGNVRNFYGDRGTLNILNSNSPTFNSSGALNPDTKVKGDRPVEPVDCPNHWLNWLQCMRDKQTPNASIDDGYKHAVAVLMAVRSYETGRKTVFDPKKRAILTV